MKKFFLLTLLLGIYFTQAAVAQSESAVPGHIPPTLQSSAPTAQPSSPPLGLLPESYLTTPPENMTQEQYDQLRQQAQEEWMKMTPEEREQARVRFKQAWRNLPPQQRAQVNETIRNYLKSLTPEEKQRLVQAMQNYWNSLPIEEREEILRQEQLGERPVRTTQ